MNRMDEMDALRKENWGEVYREVPQSVNDGVQLAFARIRAHERRRKQIYRAVSVAACLCVALGVGAVALKGRGSDAPDRVAAPVVQMRLLARDEIVYACKEDACFHLKADCAQRRGDLVELLLETALEFEKELCPACGAGVELPNFDAVETEDEV